MEYFLFKDSFVQFFRRTEKKYIITNEVNTDLKSFFFRNLFSNTFAGNECVSTLKYVQNLNFIDKRQGHYVTLPSLCEKSRSNKMDDTVWSRTIGLRP